MLQKLRTLCAATLTVLAMAWSPIRAAAAEGAADAEPPWVPSILDVQGELDLLQAVRLTLAQDPNLLLRQEDVRSRQGRSLELAGAFDWVLGGRFDWEHREQEILESVQQGERDRRAQLELGNEIACTEERQLAEKLEDLRAAQDAPGGVDIRNDRGFDAQLKIIEAVIIAAGENATADVVRGLEETRRNLIATEIEATNDALLDAAKVCRDTAEDLARIGEVPQDEEFDTVQLDLELNKLTRSGLFWNTFLRSSFRDTEFVGKREGFFVPAVDSRGRPIVSPTGIPLERLVDFGGKNFEEVYQFELGFQVNVPLLRGRGRDATGAAEQAAEVDVEAAALLLTHRASESVLSTVGAYWELVAAQERVEVLERSVELQESLVELTSALVDAEEMPGSERARTQAGRANARSQLQSARRDLLAARHELVRTMGLALDDPEGLPRAGDGFPTPPAVPLTELAETLSQWAVGQRLDLQAVRSLVESEMILARAAETELRPIFDVTLGLWTIARGESDLEESIDNVARQPSWRVAADVEKPIGNRIARGRLLQQASLVRQQQIIAADLERSIRIAVLRSLGTLDEAIRQLENAEAAAAAFERTIDTELEKLRVGETTVIDAILTEQQSTSAALAAIQARFLVAALIAQLRFETGSLVEASDGENVVRAEGLVSVPAAGEPR